MKPLSDLLDLSSLQSHEISQRFTDIAEAVLHNYCLRTEYQGISTDFEILEIEFYFFKEPIHGDPFCHAHDEQRRSANWYFHRAPRSNTSSVTPNHTPTGPRGYRGGTRKGLDLTFGASVTSPFFSKRPEASQCHGGILLRSMRATEKNCEVISGPSLLVDKILAITKSRNIAELVDHKLGGCTSALPTVGDSTGAGIRPAKLYLIPRSQKFNTSLPTIHRSPRVGLDLSHSSTTPQRNNPRVMYIARLYRYFVHPELLKGNGRCHTLLGILLEQATADLKTSQSLIDSKLTNQLIKVTMLKRVTLEKYVKDFEEGFTRHDLAKFVGSTGKGASSNPQMFMRMMGVLRRMDLLT